jgi:hypothetical protein
MSSRWRSRSANTGGEQTHFVGVLREITERKRLEESCGKARSREPRVLAGGIAHDFNSLLTGILGNISLALEEVPEWNPGIKAAGRNRGVGTRRPPGKQLRMPARDGS